MTNFSSSVDIDAPPGHVLGVLSEVERWPEWTSTMTSVQRLDAGPLAVGSRAHIRQPRLPPAKWLVTDLAAGKSFTWVSGGPGLSVSARHVIEARGSGSRATVSIDYSGPLGPLFARLTRGINERYLSIEAKGLKEHSERSEAARGR